MIGMRWIVRWMIQIPAGVGYPAGVISKRLLAFEAFEAKHEGTCRLHDSNLATE